MYQLRRILLFFIVASTGGLAHSHTGLIRGTLLDTNGSPLAKADGGESMR